MFGLDKGKDTGLSFDLEKELKSGGDKASEMKHLLSSRIEELKNLLRKGEDKRLFQETEILLHGYMALQKVTDKMSKK